MVLPCSEKTKLVSCKKKDYDSVLARLEYVLAAPLYQKLETFESFC